MIGRAPSEFSSTATAAAGERRFAGVVTAAQARYAQLPQRCGLACMIALVISQTLGMGLATGWLATYLVCQAPEVLLFWPAIGETKRPLAIWRAVCGCAAIGLNALAFTAIAIPLWTEGGAFGGMCAVTLSAAAMLNAVVSTPGSFPAMLSAIAPQIALVALEPYLSGRSGASGAYQATLTITRVGFVIYAIAVWTHRERVRRSEALAKAETDRRRAEAEAATSAKSAYVAMIGHDLRTPISAMLAGAIELEKAVQASRLRGHATLIADAGRMMKTLLDDVLDHAKLEAGRMSIEAAPFDLRRLMAQTMHLWQGEARRKGLRLRIEGCARVPRWVEGDPTRLRQIFNNLISNAIKFTDEGSVSLRVKAWTSSDEGCALTIQVSDTGVGMDREQLGRLFQAFTQADATIARNYGGTGLGLVISRELARVMGGALTAYSVKGKGSTFTLALTLPLAEAQPSADDHAQADASELQPREGPSIRVLVADDHEINRRAVRLVLEPLGAEIVDVSDGRAALNAAMERPFDIIIMDVRMPEMDGHEATRQIRARDGVNRDTPIVAVTADTDGPDIEACLSAGMNLFVGKPIDPARLIDAVVRALDPQRDGNPGSVPAAETEDDGGRPLRVLVADDHEINRRAVQLVLEPAGARITAVADGRAAYEAALLEAFDVIVMDVRMPEMDGREATRMIRSTPGPNQNVPVIAVTAETDDQACYAAGMDLFVGKPIDPGRLLNAVADAIALIEARAEATAERQSA